MIIGNFTPDDIEWMHIGINGVVKSGATEEMDDARARHILNKVARRGLVQMQFGDDIETKKKASLEQWTNFWEHQITQFNQHNEDQKEKGNRYARPTDELKAHAKVLGLELLQPWRIEAKDSPQMAVLQSENVQLKLQLDEQSKQIQQILEMVKAKVEPAPEQVAPEQVEPTAEADFQKAAEELVVANKKKYASLSANTMSGWLKNNWDAYLTMPEENKFEIETRYQELYQTPFPIEKPA